MAAKAIDPMVQSEKLPDLAKEPIVQVTEFNPESSSSGGSHDLHNDETETFPDVDRYSISNRDNDGFGGKLSDSHAMVFDETHDAGLHHFHQPGTFQQAHLPQEQDLTIDTVLDTDLPLHTPIRRAISSGQFSEASGSDTSFTNPDSSHKLTVPKLRARSSLQPAVKRTWSAETTLTRRSSAQLKTLSIEERLVKSHASLKDLQFACSLPSSRDKVAIQHVFDLIYKIRMRQVPHQWSAVDRRLKQAQSSAERVADFIKLVKNQGSDAEAVASMFYACCELSLQGGALDAAGLDSLLNALHRTSVVLQHVRTAAGEEKVSSEVFYSAVSRIVLALQKICVGFIEMLDDLRKDSHRNPTAMSVQVNKYFEADISSLMQAAREACQELWLISLKGHSDTSLAECHGHILDWLNDNTHGRHDHGLSQYHEAGSTHSFVFDCIEPLVTKFFKTPSRLLLVTGEAGYGEQEMVSNLVERLRLSLTTDAKLLRGSLGSSQRTAHGTAVPFLKSLLKQLLDESVGNTSLLSAINNIMKRSEHETASRTEDLLWELLADECSKAVGHVAVVVDGLLPGDNGTSANALITKLQELTSKCTSIRCLALADPDATTSISGVQIYALSRGDIRRNARQFLQGAMAASTTLSVLSSQMRQDLLRHIAERQWTSLLEAKLILRLLESEHDLARMPDIICKTPKTVQGMLDHMILKIDFKSPELQTLLSWLLVGKRAVEVSELERNGSVAVSNWLRRIRSGRSVSSNSFLAGIISVQGGYVQFVDSLVKARMHHMALHGKIPLSLHMAHRQVSLDCLKHAHQQLQQKVDLVFQDPAKSKWATASSYSEFDGLLVYSVRNWYEHYEKSLASSEKLSRHIPAEIISNLPDSVLMSLAEWHYLRAQTESSDLGKSLSKLLALRKAVLGPHAPSVIQSMINLAHAEKPVRLSSVREINVERLVDAFDGTVTHYGDPSSQATAGAKYIFSIIKPQTSLPPKGFKVYEYLWGVCRRELGDSHDETLLVAQRLAELYKAEMRFAEAGEILHDMYEACCRTRGLFASKTIELFHLLIDTLEQSDNMADAQQLCQDIFDAAPTLETWNEAVLTAVCRIVRHYQDRGMAEVSKGKLQQLWALLQGQFKKDNNQAHLLVAFTFVSLQLATKMRDLSLEDEASSTLKAFWVIAAKYVTTDRRCDLSTLTQLRKIAQLLLRLEHNEEALSILRVVYEIHQLPSSNHFDEMLQVYSALITCYKSSVKSPLGDFLWLNILDSILLTTSGHEQVRADTVFLCRDLAVLHRSRAQWTTATSICRKSLNILWPKILSLKDGDMLSLPTSYARECVQIAVVMAQMYSKTNEKKLAESLLQSIIGCCKRHIFTWSKSSQEIAGILSLALEQSELTLEALKFWQSILGECRTRLGHSHQFTLQVAAAIVRLSVELNLAVDDDEVVCGVLEIEPDEDDLESISLLIEGLLAMCRSCGTGKKDRGSSLLKWYERLWSYYFDLRHDLAMDTARGFEIFEGYSAVLISTKSISMAIRLARKLRATFLSDFGRQDIWYLKASLELTKLLEMDDTTIREAVDIYDEINEIGMILSATDDAVLAILRIVQDRLSVLVSSKPLLHDRAEQILIKAWQQTVKKHGYTHEHSMSSLQKLLAFWASILNAENKQKAEDILKEAILGTIAKEVNPKKLFALADRFFGMYQLFSFTYRDLDFLSSVRTQIFRFESKQTGLCGQAYLHKKTEVLGSYDRRCLVLVYAMEAFFQNEKKDGLLADILIRVVAEAALYEAWLRASLKGSRLDDMLASGTRLIEHLEIFKLHSESHSIQEELWVLFCRSLGRTEEKKGGSMYLFFLDILAASHQDAISASLLETGLIKAQELADAGNHQACFRLSEWIYSYGKASTDLDDSTAALLLLKLATLLYTCSEVETVVELRESIVELATRVGTLAMGYTSEIDLSVMSISHLTFILGIAGKQKDYKTLKQILELLWNSRNNYDFNLTPTTTISIGKRLAEVHFACGEHDIAFALLEDITYNLKDVYDVNHPLTLQCQRLLASMHESLGHHKSAITVRFSSLRDALCIGDEDDIAEMHRGGIQLDENISFYLDQLRSLRCGYATAEDYSWHLEQNMDCLEEIVSKIKTLMKGSETSHDVGNLLDLEEWRELEQFEVSDDMFDVWYAPDDWTVELELEPDCDESAWSAVDI